MPYSKRKSYSSQFKFERSIEALKNNNLSEISRKYNVGANVLSNWKKQLLSQGSHIFDSAPDSQVRDLQAKVAKLEQMIGKKEIELNLIKNFSDFYQSQNTP